MDVTTLSPTVEQIDLTDSGDEDEPPRREQEVDLTDAEPENGAPLDGENIDVDLTEAGPEGVQKINVDLTDSGPEDEGEEPRQSVAERIEVDLTDAGLEVEVIREPEVDLTNAYPECGEPGDVEKVNVDLTESGPENEDLQEPDVERNEDEPSKAEPEDEEDVQMMEVEQVAVDLTESGPEDEESQESANVTKEKKNSAKVRKRKKSKKETKRLVGVKVERFRFLLKQGYRLRQSLLGSHKRPLFEAVATSVALAIAERHSQQDPWLFETLKEGEKNHYHNGFMKSFHALLEQGETVDDAWTLARREADTRTVLEFHNVFCDPKSFEGKARIVICNTNHPEAGITSEEFRSILAEMKNNLAKIKDIRYIPHLVECRLVPGTGYILAICCDDITIRWVRLTLKWMTLWPGASLCMVREKKFLESCFMTLSVPDIARTTDLMMKLLKAQNRPLALDNWSLLTAEPIDKEKVKKLTFLLPLKDRDQLQARNFTLNYQHHKLKLDTPEDRTKIGKRALFRGVFRQSAGMETEEIFKTIEDENEGVKVTSDWKQLHRNAMKTVNKLSFYVDAASAEAIRAADCKISYKLDGMKLTPQTRVSEI